MFEIGIFILQFCPLAFLFDLCFSWQKRFARFTRHNYGITPLLKLGLWDYARFEIGIMGLQDPP